MSFELNFEQLQKKLKKVLNPSRFRFIIILYPNTKMIDEIKNHISKSYPDSLVTNLDLEDKSYQDISNELYKNDEGFVYINDFEQVLNNANLYNGFNQRRDKIASHNINLICFISLYKKNELFTKALNVIPDLWEFKNTVLELEKDERTDKLIDIKVTDSSSYSSIGGLTTKDKKIELEKLLLRFAKTKDNDIKLNLLYQITTIYQDMGEYQKALEYQKKNLELTKEILGDKDPELAISYNNISTIYQDMGEQEKALEYQKKALELKEEILGGKNLELASSYNNISMIYQDMGELEKALEYQKKALELKEEILGDKHPSLATSYNNISIIYKDKGELEKALEYQKKALKLKEEVLGDKHPSLATSYNNISLIYKNMGELDKALKYQKKALELQEEVLGDKHPNVAISYLNIAEIYFRNSDIKEAKKYIDKSVNIFSTSFPNGHPHLDTALNSQKIIYSK